MYTVYALSTDSDGVLRELPEIGDIAALNAEYRDRMREQLQYLAA